MNFTCAVSPSVSRHLSQFRAGTLTVKQMGLETALKSIRNQIAELQGEVSALTRMHLGNSSDPNPGYEADDSDSEDDDGVNVVINPTRVFRKVRMHEKPRNG